MTIKYYSILFVTGTPALTTRGLKEADIDKVVDCIDRALQIAQDVVKISGSKLAEFNKVVEENAEIKTKIHNLKEEIENFSRTFPLPGFDQY